MDEWRRLAAIFFAVGLISVLSSTASLDWSHSFSGVKSIVKGQIIGIEKLDDRTEVIISTDEGRVLASIYDSEPNAVEWRDFGRKIELVLEVEKPKSAGNPGGFDYRQYLYGRDVYGYGSLKPSEIRRIEGEANVFNRLRGMLLSAREKFLCGSFSDEEARELAGGILFGMGRNISGDVREEFMEGGAGHILAVSGLHIGILYSLYKAIEKKLKTKSSIIKKALVIMLFAIYGTVSLWSVSVTRAVLLILIKEVADLFDLRFDGLTALAIASDIMLILRPYLVFSAGFQMSFLAIIGIYFMRPKIMYVLKEFEKRHMRRKENSDEWMSALATMISVQGLMIPYTIYVHNRFALLTLINNWILIALAGIYVPIGAALFFLNLLFADFPLVGVITPYLTSYLGSSLTLLGNWMVWINRNMIVGGHAVIRFVSPQLFFIAGILAGLFYLSSEEYKVRRKREEKSARLRLVATVIATTAFAFAITFNPVEFSDAVFLDVGQGDSLHLSWGDANILIDGGGSTNYNVGEKVLRPYLLHVGVSSVDMAISTHEHMDHFLGIEQLSESYRVEEIITRGTAGDCIVLDDERYIEILWPIPGYENSDDENYYSRIFKVHDRGITTLVTGDITEDGEKALINHYRNGELESHILKVAHHGSRFSTSEEFIEAVSPIIAVISVGKNNYGHPAPFVIEKLERQGIITYRTDRDGAIGIIVGDGKFFVCGNRRNMRIEEYRVN
ncbi:MAG: DNA internalization-related competence protein ComEC/Rec2 [Firmicutes bacterium]|nr:DNA internalization-related competence protein ComEC/Rec2 [Bacillota bacterium]